VVISQGDVLWADLPGNLRLPARITGLSKDSVANVSQVIGLDRTVLTEAVDKLPRAKLRLLLSRIDVILRRGPVNRARQHPAPALSTCRPYRARS
jgi:mRNA-degrading endonuclease toxin of MazEF toxin-antitoxin module